MSEQERRRRLDYKLRRKKLIILQSIIIVLLAIVIAFSAFTYHRLNQTYYISYNENSSVDYKVYLKENDFYEEEWIGKDHSYIASLIDHISATFSYKLDMDTANVDYEYSYEIEAQLLIVDKQTGRPLYSPTTVIKPELSAKQNSTKKLNIKESVVIDYQEFNRIASSFVDKYDLRDITCSLNVTMNVIVNGSCDEFENDSNNKYNVSLSVPLTNRTVDVEIASTVPTSEGKVIACAGSVDQVIFKRVAIISGVIDAILIIILLSFIYLTRNEDINYTIKVKKILRNYRSFIQKINNEFNTDGYQILTVNSFGEMLGIRDTIQSPVLMCENADHTRTRFVIPSNTKILYMFEIKVDDYDDIYGPEGEEPVLIPLNITHDYADKEEPASESETMTLVECETADEAIEHTCEPATIHSEDAVIIENEKIADSVGDEEVAALECVDKEGHKIKIACKRSFTANLIQSNPQVKSYYSETKNKILSFRGVKARISWRCESFYRGRKQLFKLKIRGKTICLYCALDPNEFDRAKYFHEEANAKIYADVPMLVRIRSDRGLKKALGLIDTVMNKFSITENPNHSIVDYPIKYPYATTAELVDRGLIKLLYPDAVAAEPSAHHHVHKKLFTVEHDNVVEEITIFDEDVVTPEEMIEVAEAPIITLEEIDYDENSEPTDDIVDETEEGIEVIGVVWPEKSRRNKIYRYDPDGETVEVGDTVIVPTRDAAKNRDVVRRALVAHRNHKVLADAIIHPLKKIIGIIRRKSD